LLLGVSGLVIALPLQPPAASMGQPAQGQADAAHEQKGAKPDPCEQLSDARGRAFGLHKRCEILGGGSGVARGDFNGDQVADLAVGAPDENITGAADAGAVNIIYGSIDGLAPTGNQFFHQDSPGIAGVTETGDRFGLTLAAGDFNGDGFSDLAVGTPFEETDGIDEEGFVQILNGSENGLQPAEFWDAEEIEGVKCGCRFGGSLAWGDFDQDGFGDLAIGMPLHDVRQGIGLTSITFGGVVRILFGSDAGLTANGSQSLHQNAPFSDGAIQVGEAAELEDRFGATLAAGDHNGDGFDDLAVGVPYEDTSLLSPDAGIVHVVFGSPTGFTSAIKYVQGEGDTPGASESGDRFGLRLTMGDFNGNGIDDLVVGVPYEDVGSDTDAGAVYVIERFGERRGWDQDLIPGVGAESGDLFGWAVAAADFNLDGEADLAIGVPNEDFGSPAVHATFRPNTGLVNVLYGSFRGLSTTGAQIWHQDVSGVAGSTELGDQFGFSLSAWNFGKSAHRDLAIGVPGKNITTDTTKGDAGAVVVLYGSGSGLSSTDSQQWSQASAGILDAADTDDRFGASLY
jgi:hypothetical protein